VADRRGPPRRWLGWLGLVACTLAVVELACFGFAALRPQLFSRHTRVLRKLARAVDRYPEFLALRYEPVTGWDSRASDRSESEACDGRRVVTTTRADRSRLTPMEDAPPLVLLFGDSYTLGQEVNDDETYAWRLSQQLGVAVRNHGVAGFSPVQATLKLERLAGAYPAARLASLAIMHEDVKRMLNRYRPVENSASHQLFGFKPYAEDARILPNPNGPLPVPAERLRDLARDAFRHDYFARPVRRFPYTWSVLRLLANPVFHRDLEERRSGHLRGWFEDARVVATLGFVVERFVAACEAQGLRALVSFLPRSARDLGDSRAALEALRERLGARATLTDVGDEPGDWTRYNVDAAGDCHPSAYGHELIATHLARVIQPLLATTDSEGNAR
jgi:hypothetical protein